MTDKHGAQDSDPGWHLGDPTGADGAHGPGPGGLTDPDAPDDALADDTSSVTRRGSHPDIEVLDAYLDTHPEPPGPGRSRVITASRVDRHVRGCVTCQETLAALHRVRAELARLATMTMPDEVAARIQAALASRSGAGGDDAEPGPGRGPADSSGEARQAGQVTKAGRPGGTNGTNGTSVGGAPLSGPGTGGMHDHPGGAAVPGGLGSRRSRVAGGLRRRREREPVRGRGPGPGLVGGGQDSRAPRRGQAAQGRDRITRDWVSIAAACVALLAFGTALLAVRALTGGGSESYSAATSASDPAVEVAADSASGPAAAAAPVPDADTDALAEAPGGTFVLVGDSDEVLRPATVVAHGHALLAGRIAVTRLAWSMAGAPSPRADDPLAAPPRAGGSGPGDAQGGQSTPMRNTPESLVRLIDTPQLRMCYDGLAAQTGGTVIALDRVRFDDQAAIMIVLSVAGQPTSTRLVIIDAHCGVVPAHSAVWYSVNANRA
ncbi:hypothetical protein CC117_15270 [Parafrankia colletiae]|uniref:Zinc-finger domain-containing protein n=1 Tax=Parafrankia colletiae TaxID=573497 RepID=A0A1S1QZ30_9ACTN|nr:hypothetical protein [Parafrankia colletiae]MCK9903358.1 hypothetical protein [Frankia sp. Cpl3]OHV38312.1 hypothetical protein CC117_15270 [Parafrankia colletiae]